MPLRAGIVLQARLASTRLPAKAVADIGGVTMLQRCFSRLCRSAAGEVILATTDDPMDDVLAGIAAREGIAVYRGGADDVLGRYVTAALLFNLDIVIRATADNPAVDIDAPQRVLAALEASGADYACEDGLPLGAGVEAVTLPALIRTALVADASSDREHVTSYIKQRPQAFRVMRAIAPRHLCRPGVRLTVDTAADLRYVRRLFALAGGPDPSVTDLIAAADIVARSEAA